MCLHTHTHTHTHTHPFQGKNERKKDGWKGGKEEKETTGHSDEFIG